MGYLQLFNKDQIKRDIGYLKNQFPHVRPGLVARKYIRTLMKLHEQSADSVKESESARRIVHILAVKEVVAQFKAIFPLSEKEAFPAATTAILPVIGDAAIKNEEKAKATAFMRFFRKVFPKKYEVLLGTGSGELELV